MSDVENRLIKFARKEKIKQEEWIEAIEHLYAAQVDIALEDSDCNLFEHTVVMNDSVVHIRVTREVKE